jgi:hypothetical protein
MSKLENAINRLVGRTKQVLAEILGDDNLRREGRIDEKKGREDRTNLSFRDDLNNLS